MKDFSIDELVNIGFDYMIHLMQESYKNGEQIHINSHEPFKYKDPQLEYASANDLSKSLFGFMTDAKKYNQLPAILSDHEFDLESGTTFYHGFKKPLYVNDFVNNFLYHYGNGLTSDNQYINGFYLTKHKNLASLYTAREIEDTKADNILSIKLEDVKFIKLSEIRELTTNPNNEKTKFYLEYKELQENLDKLMIKTNNSREFRMYKKAILSNFSTIAVLLGAEILIDDEKTYNKENNEQVIVLNRGAVSLKQSEVNNALSKLNENNK